MKRERVPVTRIFLYRHGKQYSAKAYDADGMVRSQVPWGDLKYVMGKLDEWFPGVPVEPRLWKDR